MLKEEKLDVFLDAFLDGKKPAQETDLDFWDEKSEPEKNDFWEAQDVLTAPKHKGKLSKRTIASMFLILILILIEFLIFLQKSVEDLMKQYQPKTSNLFFHFLD